MKMRVLCETERKTFDFLEEYPITRNSYDSKEFVSYDEASQFCYEHDLNIDDIEDYGSSYVVSFMITNFVTVEKVEYSFDVYKKYGTGKPIFVQTINSFISYETDYTSLNKQVAEYYGFPKNQYIDRHSIKPVKIYTNTETFYQKN